MDDKQTEAEKLVIDDKKRAEAHELAVMAAKGDSQLLDMVKSASSEKLLSTEYGKSFLARAIESHHLNETASAIIDKPEINSKHLFKPDQNGKTYLDIAIEAGNLEAASKIVKKASQDDLAKWLDNPKRASLDPQVRKAPDNDFRDSAHGASVDFAVLEASINKKLSAKEKETVAKTDTAKLPNGGTQIHSPEQYAPRHPGLTH
jgi:hypothetical protein